MNARRGLVWLALLVLPACLDPIVGTECATGYSPCQGVCVATGTCAASDAGSETASEAGAASDGTIDVEGIDASASLDSTTSSTGEDARTISDGQVGSAAEKVSSSSGCWRLIHFVPEGRTW